MEREREAVKARPTEIRWLLLALTTVVLGGCSAQRPLDPSRVNPDLAMERTSLPHFVLVRVGDGASPERRVPAHQIVVVPAGESILSLVRKLSHRPLTVREEVEVIAEVKRLNPHIFNPDIVRPGTRVVLPGCIGCNAEAERDGGV